MFQVRPAHIRRVSFSSKIFPKLKSSIGLDTRKLKSVDQFDGELFCGGRSKNKDLLTFFGLIDATSGLAAYGQLPTFRRSLKKLISLVERELEVVGAQEVLLPTIVPQTLWYQSKRLERQKNALESVYKFVDNSGNELLLGPTFEESITRMIARGEPINESELPLLLYQTSPKFRHEPNPRFGLLRSNEFIMNDLYTFDANIELASKTYELLSKVYSNIFKALELKPEKISSTTGSIGGKFSHEYQLSVPSGEDTVVKCGNCSQAYNIEMYQESEKGHNQDVCLNCGSTNITKSQALELGHTFLLSDIYSEPLKAKYTSASGSRHNLQMGCYGLGLTRILGAGVDLLSIIPKDSEKEKLIQIRWPTGVEPYKVGIVAPAKRSKQYHGGSTDYIEKLVNRLLEISKDLDIIVEDRDNEGIGRRLFRLQSLGVPYIITVGQRFLQERPEVELLELDSAKENYVQHWFSVEQICDYFRDLESR